MNESTIAANGRTTIPASIRRSINGAPGTRLVWHVLSDGRLFVRVKNKTAADVKGILRAPKDKRLDQELGALADAAKGAADRAGSAIDDAMSFIAASNKRIASMEAVAAKSAKAAARAAL